ncbi:MAG TPA: BamA/TamA family outer membrane protein [Puia sp.]
MLYRRQVTVSFLNPAFVLTTVLLTMLFSCTVPRKYQEGKPFVFSTNIKVEGNIPSSEKQDLTQKLSNQLDDSIRTQVVSIAGIYKRVMSPPVFDTANMRRSLGYMIAGLNSYGYYAPVIKDTFRIKEVKGKKLKIKHWRFVKVPYEESRVSIDFRVWPGKQLKFDSIGYALHTPALQALTLQSRSQTLLHKGKPYSKQVLSAELDRLVELFRNNGYYYFSKEDLVVVRDTVVAALIDPNLDPFEQAALLAKLKKKREHPTIDVVIEQRPVKDSSRITKYYIGHVTVYPDLPVLEDTVTVNNIDTSTAKNFTIISRSDKFKPTVITNNVYLRPTRLYRQLNANRTINRFNQMGAWQQASVGLTPSYSSDSVLDVTLRLYPAKKQYLNADLEASRNTGDIIAVGNLFGVGLNLGLRNRNTFRQAVLTTTNLRGGVELGSDFIQTTQASISHTISFPRLIAPFPVSRERRLDSLRSVLNFNAAYTDRRQFFTTRSFNTSWGYQWSRGNRSFLFNPLNIEYTNLNKTDSFQKYLDSIPSLNLAFKSGLVIGQQFVYSSLKTHGIHTDYLRISGEESGALLGFIKSLDEGELWRYIKGDIEYRHHIDYKRTQLAFRAFAGYGLAYGREGSGYEQTLPFYKAFFAGGPNSMRAWQIRQLGLGSSTFYSQQGSKLSDRFGDVQLESNVEYRFPLGTVFGVKLKSALYVDAGNIWNRDTAVVGKGSDFRFDRFYKEIAVGAGTGLRLDFDYFLIRFDWAYKLRDPQRLQYPDRWFYAMRLTDGQFQLGIGYPF